MTLETLLPTGMAGTTADAALGEPERSVPEWATPTRPAAMLFRAKVAAHRAARGVQNACARLPRLVPSQDARFPVVLGESRTPLWTDVAPGERTYQLGKVQNLRRAIRELDRVRIPADGVFSFWKQVGRASRRRGFVVGRMLQGGCMVPAVGGGLCQVSNALYDAALRAGCDIVERHPHSRRVPGVSAGRDATVAWNYVDLRFRSHRPMQIEAGIRRNELVVRLRGRVGGADQASPPALPLLPRNVAVHAGAEARSCAECGETSCFRHEPVVDRSDGRTAYLVDENWPEFCDHVRRRHAANDVLGLPLDGARWRFGRYRWDTRGFSRVGAASLATIRRALAIRRSPAQGALRRAAELAGAERIAHRLSRLLTYDVTRVCVAQSLLPFLWREGHLAGREVEVLMTRLPIAEIQRRLDRAAAAHPDRPSLSDFRAPPWLVEAETEALAEAARIITPHREIARLFPDRAAPLEWMVPAAAPVPRPNPAPQCVAFPGPTIARKGAYEVREAARALDLEIILLGGELEGSGFWDGVRTRPTGPGGLSEVAAVVQPALVEERPRHLLAALAAGVPVIATSACGLAPHALLTIVPPDDPEALIAALRTATTV